VTEKLRSHLGKTRGFTLVELLIVIAIIAILVLLVIVALDPLERIRDTNDRSAQNEVRSGVAAVAACITKEESLNPGSGFDAAGNCSSAAMLAGANYISNATSLQNLDQWAMAADNICLGHENAGGHERVIWNFNTGQVTDAEVAGNTCGP
jgi:prepilin-type N-terminal cleavage/methylation domain-containing protein